MSSIRTTSKLAPVVESGLTAEASRKLGTWIVKSSPKTIVKLGKTNGRICLHIIRDKRSLTIYDPTEWAYHEWNDKAKPRKREADADVLDAVANREAVPHR